MPWMMFTGPANRICQVHWEWAARTVLSQCHAPAGRHPGNPRFSQIVEALSGASPQFHDWWAEHPIDYFRPAIIAARHPGTGLIQLEMFQLRLVNQPVLIMVIQVPSNQTYLARVNSLPQP
jgi:MmyB-like transcription regulator ligand binding domain